MKKPVVLSWSGGKDCAWALRALRSGGDFEVLALATTLNQEFNRVAMHGIRRELLEQQAAAIGLPLWTVDLPWPCSNEDYEIRMRTLCERARGAGVQYFAFGDLFLQDVQDYRVRQLSDTGLEPLFPVWGIPTAALAREMIAAGVKAKLTCIDSAALDASFAGREFDEQLLRDLPAAADPCGENGEFHTLVYAGPMFRYPLSVRTGETVVRDRFVYADVLPDATVATNAGG